MRWPIRLQILLPFVAVVLLAITALTAVAVRLASRHIEQQTLSRLQTTIDTLAHASFPLTTPVLERMRGVANRAARYQCVIALADHGRILGTWAGSVEGEILDEQRGTNGFGYDPMFYHPAFGCTFGEATAEQKLSVSHRGQAFRKLIGWYRGIERGI